MAYVKNYGKIQLQNFQTDEFLKTLPTTQHRQLQLQEVLALFHRKVMRGMHPI